MYQRITAGIFYIVTLGCDFSLHIIWFERVMYRLSTLNYSYWSCKKFYCFDYQPLKFALILKSSTHSLIDHTQCFDLMRIGFSKVLIDTIKEQKADIKLAYEMRQHYSESCVQIKKKPRSCLVLDNLILASNVELN